jgi:endonuclease/exonuclease/phosphatase family metal-dependent hydrolase
MDLQFFPTLSVMEELYGDAILTKWPARTVKAGALPGLGLPGLEPRGALWSSVTIGDTTVQVINTHLSFLGRERLLQVNALLSPEWLAHAKCREPVILMGDLNTTTASRSYRRLVAKLRDACRTGRRPGRRHNWATFPTRYPTLRLDYILVGPSIEVLDVEVVNSPLAQFASDHLPVIAELSIAEKAGGARQCFMSESAEPSSSERVIVGKTRI